MEVEEEEDLAVEEEEVEAEVVVQVEIADVLETGPALTPSVAIGISRGEQNAIDVKNLDQKVLMLAMEAEAGEVTEVGTIVVEEEVDFQEDEAEVNMEVIENKEERGHINLSCT